MVFLADYSFCQSVVILREHHVSSPKRSTPENLQHEGRQVEEVKDRLHDPRFVDRYLPNVTDVTNVTGNSPRSRSPIKSVSYEAARIRAITVIEGRRRSGIVKSRLCELSTLDPFSIARKGTRLSLPIREILREIFVIPDFHATGLLYDGSNSYEFGHTSAIIPELYDTTWCTFAKRNFRWIEIL